MYKKILIVSECFYPEEFKINDVALSWKKKGYAVDVLTLVPTYPFGKVYPKYKNKIYSKDNWQGINIFRLLATEGYRDSTFKKSIKYMKFMILASFVSLIIGKKYDYVFGFNMSVLTTMLPAILIKKFYKKPVTFWALDIWPDSVYAYGFKKTKVLSFLLNKFVKFMYCNIDNIAISSKGYESKLRLYTRPDLNFNYLPQWADDLNVSLRPAKLSLDKKVHFTFAGNIGKVQNLENIIRAFSFLPPEYQTKYQFNLIGDGSNLVNLKQLAKENKNIVFHGKKRRSDMASYYKASDFLIISLIDKPIFSLTVPAKTQTYIAAKKPILAIIKGDTANIIKDNNLGLAADPEKIEAIVSLFRKCIKMSELERENFIKKNDYLLTTIFNKENTIDKLLKLLISQNQ